MLQLYHELSVDGKTIIPKTMSRSFLKNFILWLYQLNTNYSSIQYTNTKGVVVTLDYSNTWSYPGVAMAFAGDERYSIGANYGLPFYTPSYLYGINVGTGSTSAVTITDYTLQTPIIHGIASGQLEHFGNYWQSGITIAGSDASFWVDRIFRNSSGDTITIYEIGFCVHTLAADTYGNYRFLFARDLLASGVAVNDGEYLKARYTFTVTA